MMNNDFFEPQRFACYFRKLLTERWRSLLAFAAILIGILLIIEVWVSSSTYSNYLGVTDLTWLPNYDPTEEPLTIAGILLILIGSCISAARMLTDGQQKAGRIHVLTTPVSPFEMWLGRWLIYIVGYLILFLACFYLLDLLRVAIYGSLLPYIPIRLVRLTSINHFANTPRVWHLLWLFYFFAGSWYALGSYFFPRRPLLATSVCLFIVGLLFFFVMFMYGSDLFYSIDVSKDKLAHYTEAWLLVITLSNWALSYLRLKELEITDHH